MKNIERSNNEQIISKLLDRSTRDRRHQCCLVYSEIGKHFGTTRRSRVGHEIGKNEIKVPKQLKS